MSELGRDTRETLEGFCEDATGSQGLRLMVRRALERIDELEAGTTAVVDGLGDIGHDYEQDPAGGVKVLASRLGDAEAQRDAALAEVARLRKTMLACVSSHEDGSTTHGINLMRSVLAEP